jgi:hypothetical protein
MHASSSASRHARFVESLPHLLLTAVLFGLLVLAERGSKRYEQLLQEDGWVEWATFLAFAAAAQVGVRAAFSRRAKQSNATHRLPGFDSSSAMMLMLGVFCVFVAGEEISWGQRLLGFRPPNYFLEQNYQQEANLHNLLKNVLDTRFVVLAIALLYGVVAPFLADVTRWPSALAPKRALMAWFAAVAWLEYSYPYELVGELAELMLGLLLLVDLCDRVDNEPLRAPVRGAQLGALALLAAVFVVPLNDGLLRWNSEGYRGAAREDLETLKDRIAEGELIKPKLLRKKRVHKRMYTAVRAGYLALDEKRFYLDPWNNPYWIAFEREAGDAGATAILYSFGPNRRRDLVISEADEEVAKLAIDAPHGDDIRVMIHLPSTAHAER